MLAAITRYPGAMRIWRGFMISLALGTLTVLGTRVPLLSMLIGLVAFPILSLPPFDATGPHADYGFAWIIVKSPLLWALLIAYFTALYGIVVFLWMRRR